MRLILSLSRCAAAVAVAAPLVAPAHATRIELTTAGLVGVTLDGAGPEGRPAVVPGAPGLVLTGRSGGSGGPGQRLNAVSDSFGVGTAGRLEPGERAVLRFNRAVSLTRFDFVGFGLGAQDAFLITLEGPMGVEQVLVEARELANRSSQVWEPTGADAAALTRIPAGTDVALTAATAGSSLGVQRIDVLQVPEPGAATLGLAGASLLTATRRGRF